jgi:hypothetical protein
MANKSKKRKRHEEYIDKVVKTRYAKVQITSVNEDVKVFKAAQRIPRYITENHSEDDSIYDVIKGKMLEQIGKKLCDEGYVKFNIEERYDGLRELRMKIKVAKPESLSEKYDRYTVTYNLFGGKP